MRSIIRMYYDVTCQIGVWFNQTLVYVGFGLSTRFNFPTDPKETEETYIKLLEGWRHTLNLQRVFIGGHSFGGFLATSYALKYQDRSCDFGFQNIPMHTNYIHTYGHTYAS